LKKYDIGALAILLERLRRLPKEKDFSKVHERMRKHLGRGRKRG
jgi:hypothetical protein